MGAAGAYGRQPLTPTRRTSDAAGLSYARRSAEAPEHVGAPR
ncbi:hypothetical protein BURPS1106B_A2105 [Burkholderia pseudomallei 1106b]|uniref:Uncharacterized protein n=1 Tax=Burkholderia pseudomallei (strain 1106a) TaxID=357348 RepID=A3NXR1_BURP0|nr:hypothetical protein BURPS1106A_2887 [Burkholderia pseudomallei 1106a]AFR16779.1 hypothetical protein BPC006_I2926 [Burkholderia pseudomallei BPC006]EES24596.1 hypothetical protein BURPS1106B_A2105 [Burkholderia pseudomallei 1106b]